ncbi:MAG: zinc ribbon domain-containing protein [Thermomicrobiales bacterium]
METCSNCGAVARPGAKFCTTCGSRLSAAETPASGAGWQQSADAASTDTEVAPPVNASGSDEASASEPDDTSTGVSSPVSETSEAKPSWSWGSSDSPSSTETDTTELGNDAEKRTESTPAETTSPSWSWSSSTNGADDADPAAVDHDQEDATTIDVDAREQEDQDEESAAETETSQDGGISSPPANISSSATDTASNSAWSWGESQSEPKDASGASGGESASSTSEVTASDAGADAKESAVLSTPVPDAAEEKVDSTASEDSAVDVDSHGDRSSSHVDVSSAFKDATVAGNEGEGEETLSSWAARWNETETDNANGDAADAPDDASTTDTVDATTATNESDLATTPVDSEIDFTEQSPLEGAPGGMQPASRESTDNAFTESTVADADAAPASHDTPEVGIEGAPGGLILEDVAANESDASDSGTDLDVTVLSAYPSESTDDHTSDTNDGGTETPGALTDTSGDATAANLTNELAQDDAVGEPSGAHGGEVTPGTDSELVDPLVGMDVSNTDAAATDQDSGSLASAGDTSAESARSRAEQLIDELRDLLPSLAASGSSATDSTAGIVEGSGSDQNLQPVIDELAAARPQSGSFDDLRAALEKARTNPRDVDTMLDLVGRVDDLIVLLDSQDRLNSAAGHAIGQLQQAGTHLKD